MDAESDEQKEITQRPKWDNKIQYLLTCIGFAVGLGNVWRFPYLCQTYGGEEFLIPYVIALVFEGLPLLHMELAIGQRLRMGSVGVWSSISPYLGGLGVASMLVSFLIGLFYNMILAWILWYFFHSFQSPLPWRDCPVNLNHTGYLTECEKSSAVNYFWYHETLNITPNIDTSGSLQWWLVLCLASAWCIVYICFIRGIETIGKAIYATATFPYLVLTIFLIRALTLPGANDGLIYLFTPNWETLKNPKVWLDAATQIFFSLSLAFGGLIAFSSYNPQKNNCERDALIVGCVNSFTSIYASIPIFAILGFKANENNNNCQNWNILTLTNAFNIGVGNITLENYGEWLNYLNKTDPSEVESLNLKACNLQTFLEEVFIVTCLMMSDILLTGLICLISFAVALIFTLGSGNYWLEIFNSYVGSVLLLIIAFFEIIAVAYVYGINRFNDDIEWMTGRRPNIYWQATWRFISPFMLLVVFVVYVVIEAEKQPTYNAWNPDYVHFPLADVLHYPEWVFAICVLLSILPVVSIPLVAFYKFMCFLKNYTMNRHNQNPYANECCHGEL
ncbi:peroxin-5 [Sarotherodon galilaeus]